MQDKFQEDDALVAAAEEHTATSQKSLRPCIDILGHEEDPKTPVDDLDAAPDTVAEPPSTKAVANSTSDMIEEGQAKAELFSDRPDLARSVEVECPADQNLEVRIVEEWKIHPTCLQSNKAIPQVLFLPSKN